MEQDKDSNKRHHSMASRLAGVDNPVDSNGNNIIRVAIESELAEAILLHPRKEVIRAVQVVSDKLLSFLKSVHPLRSHAPLINILLSCMRSERCFIQQLSISSLEVGKLNNDYIGMRLDEAVLKQLSIAVDENNILSHFKITQTLSCVLFDIFVENEGGQIQLTNNDLTHILSDLIGIKNNKSSISPYQEKAKQLFPSYFEMKGVRIERACDVNQKTGVKGIYAHDYRKGKTETVSRLGAHTRGIDKWMMNRNVSHSAFLNEVQSMDIPFVAGASGSAARVLSLIEFMQLTYDLLPENRLMKAYKTYLLAYLVACGHHSMHEVGYIYRKNGDTYVAGDYFSLVPDEIFPHRSIRNIIKKVCFSKASK